MALFHGMHAVEQLTDKTGFLEGDILYLARNASHPRLVKMITKAKRAGISIRYENYKRLEELSGTRNNQGIVLERESAEEIVELPEDEVFGMTSGIILALDGIEDPGNLGAIVRTAAGMGVSAIVLPKKKSAPAGAIALKASAGAMLHQPFCFVPGISSFLQRMREKNPDAWIVATDSDGKILTLKEAARLKERDGVLVLVLGSEGQGVSRLARERSDEVLSLPIKEPVESYNVSVSAAIFLALILAE